MSSRRPPSPARGQGGRRPTRNSPANRQRNRKDPQSPDTPHRQGGAAPSGPGGNKPQSPGKGARPEGKNAAGTSTRRVGAAHRTSGATRGDTASRRTRGTRGPGATGQRPDNARRSDRFAKKLNVRFSSGERTRQFSLRMLAIAVFALVAVIIVASPLNQYLNQQQEKRELLSQLAETTARVEVLEQELARWQDDDFVRSQARERLGYVMPGETLYLVSDPEEGTPEEIRAERTKEVNDRRRQVTPFYQTLWDSIQIAGASGALVNPSNIPLIGTTPGEGASPGGATAPADESTPADETSTTPPADEEGQG